MVSWNFLLRAQPGIKNILLDPNSRSHFRYMKGIIGEKNIVAGVLLLKQHKDLSDGIIEHAANYPRKMNACFVEDAKIKKDSFARIRLHVEENYVDILTPSGHNDRFFFALCDKPVCITRKFKGFMLPDYSYDEKLLVTALLNSIVVKCFWLLAAARTFSVMTAHHIRLVRKEFICIDWNKISNQEEITRLFLKAYPRSYNVPKVEDEFKREEVREFNLAILDAIKCDEGLYEQLVRDINFWFTRQQHSIGLKLGRV